MIQFDVGFRVDARSLETQLATIQQNIKSAFEVQAGSTGIGKELGQAVIQARNLQTVLEKASTTKGISFIGMNSELRRAGTTTTQLVSDLMAGGQVFQGTANQALQAFSNANRQALLMNSTIKEMGRVFLQSLKFTVAQQAIQTLQGSIQSTISWVQRLDAELNQIQVVSGKTADQMGVVSGEIVERSKALRVAALDYAQASQIYYQQGLPDQEVIRRADITIMAAQAANENVKNMSDMLTAVWNTYNMQGEQLERAASIGAMLGADTAIEFRDIAEAMQISASAAAQMGVSYESLASIIATVGSVTRQSASVIGNAYKTIFARFQQLKSTGTDGEVDLGSISSDLEGIGIDILDKATGELINLDEIIMKTGTSWDTYSQKQQLAIAQLVGGTRQYGQFLALMENFDDYVTNLNKSVSQTDASVLEDQYNVTLDSLDSRILNVSETWKRAFSGLYDEDMAKGMLSAVEQIGKTVGEIIQGFGGLQGILGVVGTMLISRIPSALNNIKGLVTDIRDASSPQRRIDRIERDTEAMQQSNIATQTRRLSRITNDNPGAARAINEINLETEANRRKIEVSRSVALAQENLNRLSQSGSAVIRTQASALQEELQVRQANLNTINDETTALQKQIDSRNQLFQINSSSNIVSNLMPSTNQINMADPAVAHIEAVSIGEQAVTALDASGFKTQADIIRAELETLKNATGDVSSAIDTFIQKYNQVGSDFSAQSKIMVQSFSDFGRGVGKVLSDTSTTEGLERMKQGVEEINQAVTNFLSSNDKIKLVVDDSGLRGAQNYLQTVMSDPNSSPQAVQDALKLVGEEWAALKKQLTESSGGSPVLKEAATEATKLGENLQKGVSNVQGVGRVGEQVRDLTGTVSETNETLGSSMATMTTGILMAARGLDNFVTSIKDGNVTLGQMISVFMSLTMAVGMVSRGFTMLQANAAGATFIQKMNDVGAQLQTGTYLGLTTAVKMTAAAFRELAIATAKAMAGTLIAIAVIAVIVAALVGLFKVIQMISNNIEQSKPEAALMRQRDAAEELKKAADEANQSATDLKNTLESYTSARDSLDDCTQGTKEWTNQLREANIAALDVLTSIKSLDNIDLDLDNLYARGDNGQIIISQEGMDAALQQVQDNAATMTYQAQLASIRADQTELSIGLNELVQELKGSDVGYTTDNNGRIQFIDVSSEEIAEKLSEVIDDLPLMEDEDLKSALNDLGLNLDLTNDELDNYRKSIKEASDSNRLFNEKQQAAADAIVEDALGDTFSNEVKAVVADIVSVDEINRRIKEIQAPSNWDDILEGQGAVGVAAKERIEEFVKLYNSATNRQFRADDNFVRDMDGVASFAFLDEAGELKEVTREQVFSTIATKQALDDLKIGADNAAMAMNSIADNNFGQGLREFFTGGNFNDMTSVGLARGFGLDFDKLTDEEQATKARDYLIKSLGLKGTEEEINKAIDEYAGLLGKSAEEFIQEIADGASASFLGLEGVGRNLGKRAKQIFEDINNISGLTVNEQNEVVDMVSNLFTKFGSEAAGELVGIFNAVDIPQFDEFIAEIGSVNWSAITPEDLSARLEEAGVSTDNLADKLPRLIDLMQQAASVNLSSAQKNFKDIMEAFGSLGYGDSVDADTYKMLGTGYEEYFSLMADGTYQLTVQANEFRKAIQDNAMADHNRLLRQNQRELDNVERASQYDISSMQNSALALSKNNSPVTNVIMGSVGLGGDRFDADQAQRQINYLRAIGYEQAQLAEWQSGLTDPNTAGLSEDDFKALAEAVKEAGDQTGMLAERTEELRAEQEALSQQVNNSRIANDIADAGLDADAVYNMRDAIQAVAGTTLEASEATYKYSENLKEDTALANEVAKEQVRFNKALVDGAAALEDWQDVIGPGGIKDMQKFGDVVDDIRETYANLLDVDPSTIGDDFVKDAENLELFEKILDGTVEEAIDAMDTLQEKSLLSFEFEGDIDADGILGALNQIRTDLEDFDVGDSFNFDDMSKDGQAALNELVAACGSDLGKIEELFNELGIEPISSDDLIEGDSIGVEAESETVHNVDEGLNTQTGFQAVEGTPMMMNATVTGFPDNPMGGIAGGTTPIGRFSIPNWSYRPITAEQKDIKETPVTSYTIRPGTDLKVSSTNSSRVNSATGRTPSSYRGGGAKPSGGGGGGGGGGGKKSTYSKPTEKPRYVNNTNRQEATANSISKVDAVESNLYGRARLSAMQKKNSLIAEQAQDYQRLYREAQAYLAQDQFAYSQTRLGQTMVVEYDNIGNILNQEQIDNWMIDWKDSLDAIEDETQKEAEQIAFDLSETAWNHLKDSRDKMIEFLQQGIEQLQKWIEQQIATANYQYEIDVKVNDRDIRMLEYTLTKLGESGLMSGAGLGILQEEVERFLSISESGMNTADKLIQLYDQMKTGNIDNQAGSELFGADVWSAAIENGSLTATILEAIGENTEDLISYAEELANAYIEAWNQVSAALRSYLDEFDSLNAKMENASSLLDTWISMWEESGEKYKDNSTYLRMLQTRLDAVGNSVETTRDKYMALQEAEEEARDTWEIHKDMYEEGEITGQQWDAINNVYKEARDAMLDAQADYYSSVQDYVDAIKEYEEQAAEQIVYTWDQALSNLWADVSDSMTGYDMITQIQEFFLADFEKDYHLDTLLRQTSDAMGQLTDPSRLAEYQKFLDEINEKQAEGVKLTQTDVDIMNARFKLLQAQDAYEEAQNNKNTMRQTRDASGNYVYVFSSEDTSAAEQDLADAAYELQKVTEEAAKAAASSWYETWLAYQNYVKEIDQTRYNSDEKYAQQVDYMRQMYETQLIQLKDKVIEYNDMAGFTFSETALGLMTQSENMQHTQETYVDAVGDLFTELNDMYAEYDEKIRDTASQFENSNADMKESAEDAMSAVRDQMAETARESSNLASQMSDNWTQMIRDVSDWSLATIDLINSVIEKLEEYYNRQTEVMRNDDGASAAGEYKWMQDETGGWWFGDGQGGYMQGGWFQDDKGDWYYANSDGYIEQAEPGGTKWVAGYEIDPSGKWTGAMKDDHTVGAWKEASDTKPNKGGTYNDYAEGSVGGPGGSSGPGGATDGNFSNSENDQWHGDGQSNPWWYGNSDRALYSGWKRINGRWYQFDSRGYLTGDPNGYDQKGGGSDAQWQGYAMGGFTGGTPKTGLPGIDQFPAMLAPGEYVLNPEDTSKILKAVKIVKNLSSVGLIKAADAISALANNATNINAGSTTPVQQDVRIEASFPGVSVASEIEDALNNLVNETVQLIGEKNR